MELVIAVNTITGVTLTEECLFTTNPKIATTVKRKVGSIMSKPLVSSVKEWFVEFDSDLVKVEWDGNDYWRVKPTGQRAQYFYGESAWMDARRTAADIDFKAWMVAS